MYKVMLIEKQHFNIDAVKTFELNKLELLDLAKQYKIEIDNSIDKDMFCECYQNGDFILVVEFGMQDYFKYRKPKAC